MMRAEPGSDPLPPPRRDPGTRFPERRDPGETTPVHDPKQREEKGGPPPPREPDPANPSNPQH